MFACLAAIRVDGSYKALGLLVWRRIDVAQDLLEGKRLWPDKDRLVSGISRILELVVHVAALEASIPRLVSHLDPRLTNSSAYRLMVRPRTTHVWRYYEMNSLQDLKYGFRQLRLK